jgi:formiminotetrahydrofolate cyclodeaminase
VSRSLDNSLEDWLETVAAGSTEVASGALCALSASAAAGLIVMSARRSSPRDPALAGQASVLRSRATGLIMESAEAFDLAAEALASAPGDLRLGELLVAAARAPMSVAQVAGDVAILGAMAHPELDEAVQPDTFAAVVLAEAAAASALHLVEVNLAIKGCPEILDAAEEAAKLARSAREQVS